MGVKSKARSVTWRDDKEQASVRPLMGGGTPFKLSRKFFEGSANEGSRTLFPIIWKADTRTMPNILHGLGVPGPKTSEPWSAFSSASQYGKNHNTAWRQSTPEATSRKAAELNRPLFPNSSYRNPDFKFSNQPPTQGGQRELYEGIITFTPEGLEDGSSAGDDEEVQEQLTGVGGRYSPDDGSSSDGDDSNPGNSGGNHGSGGGFPPPQPGGNRANPHRGRQPPSGGSGNNLPTGGSGGQPPSGDPGGNPPSGGSGGNQPPDRFGGGHLSNAGKNQGPIVGPTQATVPYAYGNFIPTIKAELKQEQLPSWDGNHNTAIEYFWKVQQLAVLGGYIPQALGYWLWHNLKEGSTIQLWFAMLSFHQQDYICGHYLNYL